MSEMFSVRMMVVWFDLSIGKFKTAEKNLDCEIVNDTELKNKVGSYLEKGVDDLSRDVLGVSLLTFQKVTKDQFRKLKEEINNEKGHFKISDDKILLFSDLKEGCKA